MSLFLSFLGGAAEQFTDTLQESAKTAKAEATLRMKALTENYQEVLKNNGKLQKDLKDDVDFIKAYKPDATEDQISAIVFNRPVMEAVKKHFKDNPEAAKNFDVATFTGLTNQNASPFTAAQRIESYLKMPKAAKEVDSVAEGTGFFDRVAGKQRKSAETQIAAALGVSMEELRGAKGFVPTAPDVGARFDLAQLVKKPEFKDIKDRVQVDLATAMESGDDAKVKQASEALARIVTVEERSRTEKKTEQQIQSDLITQIQQATDPKQKQQLTNQLRQRQVLAKLPGEGKSDADKISQSNLIVAATKTRDAILADTLPPGSFVVNVDPNTGASTLNIKELKEPELYKKGVEAARSAIIKEFTNPQTGMPRSEMHKNAMMSVGIQFDQTGRPIGGGMAPTLEPTAGMPAPKTKAEYDAIPSGTQYRDIDGKVKIKR